MTRFCLRAIAFLLLQGVLFVGWVWNPDYPREHGFLASTIDKHRRLERTPSPRVILAGGSNVAFGFQSPLLEQALELPVVNLGLVAGLGPGFMLNELADVVRSGDLVVLSFEYSVFGGTGQLLPQRQLIEFRPASWRYVARGQRARLLTEHGLSLGGGIARRSLGLGTDLAAADPTEFPYVREGFNAQGDYTLHHARSIRLDQMPADSPLLKPLGIAPFSPRLRTELAAFAQLCRRRGARLFYTCAPQPPAAWQVNRDAIERIVAELRSIPGLELLGGPQEQVYPLGLFSDTPDHLAEAGGRQRTLRLAEQLKLQRIPPAPAEARSLDGR